MRGWGFFIVIFSLCSIALLQSALARDELPLPPLARGELAQYYNALNESIYAPSVALSDDSILLFPEKAGVPGMLRIFPDETKRSHFFSFKNFSVPDVGDRKCSSFYSCTYSSAVSPAGVWLIGPTIELVRQNKPVLSAKLLWPRHGARTIALEDGSVMVVGGDSWPASKGPSISTRVERVYLDAQNHIRTEALPAVPVTFDKSRGDDGFFGFAALHLGKGRVLLAGGYNGNGNRAWLYEQDKNAWRVLRNMSSWRESPALALLSDGRVWVSGGNGNGADTRSSYSSEIWNPVSEEWNAGPILPVAMARHQAALTPDRKFILLAAGEQSTVLAWRPDTADVFVAAQPSVQRLQAGVLPLPNARVALVGGRHSRAYEEGWGRRTPGLTIVSLDLSRFGERMPLWPEARGGALAVHNGVLVALGGQLRHNHTGSDEEVPGRHAERMVLASRQVFSLPALPVSSQSAEACWLNEHSVLAHIGGVEGGSLHWLGVLKSDAREWKALPLPLGRNELANTLYDRHLRLAGCHGAYGWLIDEASRVWRFDSSQSVFEMSPHLQRKRQGFAARVLADGRVLVAGGKEQAELVAARTESCADCSERYIGFGPFIPSRHFEWLDEGAKEWKTSVPAKGQGTHAAILADGRVALLGIAESREDKGRRASLMLELSDREGKHWRTLSFAAPGLPMLRAEDAYDFRHSLSHVSLLAVTNEQPGLERALFLGIGQSKTDWWWLPDVSAPQPAWKRLGSGVVPLRFPAGEMDSGVMSPEGKRIYFRGSGDGVVAYTRE